MPFPKEESCYYIHETGLVNKNIEALRHWNERLKQKQTHGPWPGWLDSTLVPWLTPILTPTLVIRLLLIIDACLFISVWRHKSEVARVTFNQMLLHPYSRLLREHTFERCPHDAPY